MKNLEERFGLKDIPFKSQGSETGKYPFVPSAAFDELISVIEKIRDQKDTSAIIFRGPQGSGKTATKNGILRHFSPQTDVGIITANLSSLQLRDLAWSIIENAKEQNFIDETFLEKIGYVQGQNFELPRLEKIIILVIEQILSKKEFGILILDEFDIISQPTFHDTKDQTEFLQCMTNILNYINESKIIQEKSFCTILAQTDKSSEDFRTYISNRNKPLGSRLKKDIDIKYNFDVTKEIILQRLETEKVPSFTIPNGEKFFPLDEKIIKFLFEQINKLTLTSEMIAFRDMEQILHDSIAKSLEQNLPKVELNVVEQTFNEIKNKILQVKPEELRINEETIAELDKLMLKDDHSEANNWYLEGIKIGMKIWEPQLYKDVESKGAASRLIPNGNYKIYLNSIRLDIQSTSNHHKSILWYAASKAGNVAFTDEDFDKINSFLEQNKEEQYGCQFSILTIFSDSLTVDDEVKLQSEKITSMKKIFIRDKNLKKSIIGIALSNAEIKDIASPSDDREQFKPKWNTYLHSICTDYLGETLHDLDKELTEKGKTLVQILYAKSTIGETFQKKIELRQLAKEITNLNITENNINEIIQLGFSDEDLNPLIPQNLESLYNLIQLGKKQDEILKIFSKHYTIEAAKLLKIIDENGKLRNPENLKKDIEENLTQKMEEILPENTQSLSVNQKIVKLLLDVFERIDEITTDIKKIIVLGYIKEQAEKSLQDLSTQPTSTEKASTKLETTTTETEKAKDVTYGSDESDCTPIEITHSILLQACEDILKNEKLTLDELRQRIHTKPGFGEEQKWVTKIYDLIRQNKIFLTSGDEDAG